ncbi:PTS sugar transporter subunit IIB [Erysipelothrix larvae]|uniref:PTS sugar transporter subunit IIB n=1 Tax=Erysipelothrix larvae TaxID=1514105 RepID=A0A109UGD8_9FIRM|nr:PTS sugar transporter subunit IIB [Erysipelothrix larvae]AMC92518.1 PTS sugar transporter subunit IIB [Erysipelothrix larvae]
MRKVVLLCAAGMSTSMLVKNISVAAKEEDYEIEVTAHTISDAKSVVPGSDIVLLGPQVRFNLNGVKDKFPDIPVKVMDMEAYGKMDGKKIVALIRKTLND